MQVMTSVLHDTDSSHQPNPISSKEIIIDEFFYGFKSQLNSLDKILKPNDTTIKNEIAKLQSNFEFEL
jgi:hypothetical protein